MDAQTIIAAVLATLTVGGAVVGIALHAGKSRDMAESALHKLRNVEQAHLGHVTHADTVYARKDALEPQFKAIAESLDRIEQRQNKLIDRFMGPSA